MKVVVSVLCAVAVVFCFVFISAPVSEGAEQYNIADISRYEDDRHWLFCKENSCYFVSASKNQIVINRIYGNASCTIKYFTTESDVVGCEYVGGKFYFHCKNKEKQISVVICNFARSTLRTIKFADFSNNNRFLLSVDEYGAFYTVNEKNRYQLLKYSSDGTQCGTYDFGDNIYQLANYDGSRIIIVTGRECFTVNKRGVAKISEGYIGFPLTVLNNKFLFYSGKIYDADKNCTESFSDVKNPVTADLNGMYYAENGSIYYTPKSKEAPSSVYKTSENILELCCGTRNIYALTAYGIAVIKISDFCEILDEAPTASTEPSDIKSQIGSYLYKFNGGYITGVQSRTTVKDFKSVMVYGDNEVSFFFNGIPVTQGKIKTGTKVVFSNENGNSVKYTIIVDGDVNSDGNVTTTDTKKFADYMLGIKRLNQTEKLASDLNSDGVLSNVDLIKMARLR